MKDKITFKDLKLIQSLEKKLDKLKYITPTPIQAKSIPSLLLGKDLIGIAQTGTGKTASFVLPILQRMTETYPRVIKTIVLAPTRELVGQIGESFSKYGELLKFKNTVIFGGVGQGKQVHELNKGVDILVATPGRFLDLLGQNKFNLRSVEFFVLDEADRMLDMGFVHDIKKIITKLPEKKQSLFFSATMSPEINKLAKSLLKTPVHVEVTPSATTVERINQCVYFVDSKSKDKLLYSLLKKEDMTSILIFTRTKHRANKVASFLIKNNITAGAIHGNKSQTARTRALAGFKSGETKVLVATDIAARGIDINNISHVINYEIPNEAENYVHRIGRTARAGTDGTAFSFCAADERNYLRDIEKLTKQRLEVIHHDFHSEEAKNAVGAAAKPAPRGNNSRGSRGRRDFRGKKASGSKGSKNITKRKPEQSSSNNSSKKKRNSQFKNKNKSGNNNKFKQSFNRR